MCKDPEARDIVMNLRNWKFSMVELGKLRSLPVTKRNLDFILTIKGAKKSYKQGTVI